MHKTVLSNAVELVIDFRMEVLFSEEFFSRTEVFEYFCKRSYSTQNLVLVKTRVV